MKTIGIRELRQHASDALRRVARGETIGVTDRGRLVAVLSAPSSSTGTAALVAANRVQRARRTPHELPGALAAAHSSESALEATRGDR